MTEGNTSGPEIYHSGKIQRTRKMKQSGKRKPVIVKGRHEIKIYDNHQRIHGKIWSIYDISLEAKLGFGKPHCEIERTKS